MQINVGKFSQRAHNTTFELFMRHRICMIDIQILTIFFAIVYI